MAALSSATAAQSTPAATLPVPQTPQGTKRKASQISGASPAFSSPMYYHDIDALEDAAKGVGAVKRRDFKKFVNKSLPGRPVQTVCLTASAVKTHEFVKNNERIIKKRKLDLENDPQLANPPLEPEPGVTITVDANDIRVRKPNGKERVYGIHATAVSRRIYPKSGDDVLSLPGAVVQRAVNAFEQDPSTPLADHLLREAAQLPPTT